MIFGKCVGLAATILCVTVTGKHLAPAKVLSDPAQGKSGQDRIAFSHGLPVLDGNHLEATVVEVTYGPGESSSPHTHPCPVIGYIIEGAYRTQVKGGPEAIYKAGESFYEAPNGVHVVSANASQKDPLKFIAYFVCDHPGSLSVDVPEKK